jgi:hypothetical protein
LGWFLFWSVLLGLANEKKTTLFFMDLEKGEKKRMKNSMWGFCFSWKAGLRKNGKKLSDCPNS